MWSPRQFRIKYLVGCMIVRALLASCQIRKIAGWACYSMVDYALHTTTLI